MDLGSRPLEKEEVETLREWYKDKLLDFDPKELEGKNRYHLLYLRDCVYVEFGLRAGYRISELLSLTWKHVWDFEKGEPKRKFTIEKEKMKGKKKERKMVLGETLQRLLVLLHGVWERMYGREIVEEEWIFQSYHPLPKKMDISSMHKRLKKVFEECGFDSKELSSHSLRKTFVKDIYEKSGQDIVLTSKYTGHKKIETLMSYLRGDASGINDFLRQ